MIPAFTALDAASLQALRDLAARWREAPERPRVAPAVLAHWDRLIGDWVDDPQLPLLVRKASLKGAVREHAASGRPILHVDNSPANWALSSALLGRRPALAEIVSALRSGARIDSSKILLFPGRCLTNTVTRGRRTTARREEA